MPTMSSPEELLAEARRRGLKLPSAVTAAQDKNKAFVERYYNSPSLFAEECILWKEGEGLTFYQKDTLNAIPEKFRVCVRGPHSIGKTTLSACAVLWFALTREAAGQDWKIPTTASAWRQLTKYLWPEITKWARRLNWNKIGWRDKFNERTELLQQSLKLNFGEAFALASDDPTSLEGAHADELLYLFDESKTILPKTWESAEGAFSGVGKHYWLAVSTPGEPIGTFYEIQARKEGYADWYTKRVTLADMLAAGRQKPEWVENRKAQWGETSAVFQNRVLGEFATSDEDGVIPLSWVEAANERWHKWNDMRNSVGPGAFTCVSVDLGRMSDKTVIGRRYGFAIDTLEYYTKESAAATFGRVTGILRVYGNKAVVDGIGMGSPIVDFLRDGGFTVDSFIASHKSNLKDKSGELGFQNRRSAAWWTFRELLDPDSGSNIALPPDDLLTGDLTAPKWTVDAGSRIVVESKEQIKKRLGRSTDSGDAVIMAFSQEENEEDDAGTLTVDNWRMGSILREDNRMRVGL